jgi:phage-related protein
VLRLDRIVFNADAPLVKLQRGVFTSGQVVLENYTYSSIASTMESSLGSAGEKPLHWVGSSKSDFMNFPAQVRSDMGYALGVAQFGAKHPNAKPWKGEGPGVFEIVESHDGNAFRAIYTVRFERVIYVLHAFRKKSPTGIRTANIDVALIKDRLKTARKHYEADK